MLVYDFSRKIMEENDQSVGVQFFYCNTSKLPKQQIHKLIDLRRQRNPTKDDTSQDVT